MTSCRLRENLSIQVKAKQIFFALVQPKVPECDPQRHPFLDKPDRGHDLGLHRRAQLDKRVSMAKTEEQESCSCTSDLFQVRAGVA